MKRFLPVTLLLGAAAESLTAARPVSKETLSKALQRGGMTTAELIETIKITGVGFALSAADEQSLGVLGASPELLQAIRGAQSAGNGKSAGRPLAPVELLLKLMHSNPASAAMALKSRGAGFDLTPTLEARILESGGDKALLTLAVLRRLEPQTAAPGAPASAAAENHGRKQQQQLQQAVAEPATVETSRPILVDAAAQARKLMRKAEVQYPTLAHRARMSGAVTVQALIGKDGRVRRARVLRGDAIFHEAATMAVGKYVYKPTMLDETPVEVITDVTVEFDLSKADIGTN